MLGSVRREKETQRMYFPWGSVASPSGSMFVCSKEERDKTRVDFNTVSEGSTEHISCPQGPLETRKKFV